MYRYDLARSVGPETQMNRRVFLSNRILTASALALLSDFEAFSQNDRDQTAHLTIRTDSPLSPIASDFIGLGYEISSVARPGLMDSANHVYVQLLRTLSEHGVVRVGGNTSDYARYSSTGPAVSSPLATVVNDAVLGDLAGFLEASGWKLIWGLNLGTGTEANAIAEASAVLAAAGKRLLAFEIGNEPDLFVYAQLRKPGYGYADWLAEYKRYKTVLRENFPGIPFAGPDVFGSTDWVTRFATDEAQDAVLLTHHYYREAQNPTSTIEKLLGTDPNLQPQLAQLSAASESCGVPYRICEVNSFSGGGRPGVSDTMASALWVLDYMFTLASNGCSGVNMETGVNQLNFISSYSPIGDDEQGHYVAKPEYYGMLAFSLAGKGQMLKVDLDTSSPAIKAYAARPSAKAIVLTLINKGPRSSSLIAGASDPMHGGRASVLRLEGPAIDAKTGITLGGAEVTAAGTWRPAKLERIPIRDNKLRVELGPASAAIVQVELR